MALDVHDDVRYQITLRGINTLAKIIAKETARAVAEALAEPLAKLASMTAGPNIPTGSNVVPADESFVYASRNFVAGCDAEKSAPDVQIECDCAAQHLGGEDAEYHEDECATQQSRESTRLLADSGDWFFEAAFLVALHAQIHASRHDATMGGVVEGAFQYARLAAKRLNEQ